MKALKRLNEQKRVSREAQAFMLDLMNMIVAAMGAELHQKRGFGAQRCAETAEAVIETCQSAIKRYRDEEDDEYVWTALRSWCRDFGFDPTVGLDPKTGAVKFVGGVIK